MSTSLVTPFPGDQALVRARPLLALNLALLIVAVTLCAHPYTGIRHDGILYVGDALARLLPGEFHDDLYFAFGSQGRYTIFPTFYATLMRAFGVGGGTMAGLALTQMLYAAAAAAVVWRLVPAPYRFVSLCSVLVGWSVYAGLRIFSYAEPFLTARSLCEPIVLAGLAAMLSRRRLLALILVLAAISVHPLIGLPALAVLFLLEVFDDRRWLWLLVGGGVVLGALGLLHVGPFAQLFVRYDDEWFGLVEVANGHTLVTHWSLLDYGVILFNVVILAMGWPLFEPRARKVIAAVFGAGLLLTLTSVVLVDGLHSAFVGQLQLWRALWLVQWTAMAAAPMLAWTLWSRGDAHGRLEALLLVLGWIAPFSMAPGIVAVLIAVIDLCRSRFRLSQATVRIVGAIVLMAGVTIVFQFVASVVKVGGLLQLQVHEIVAQGLTMNLVLMALVVAYVRWCAPRPLVATVVAVAFLGVAVTLWDQRGTWTRRLESYALGTTIWPGLIEPGARVYWYRDLLAPWVLLGHANYYAIQQSSGAVFSRGMIVELEKRRKVTALLDFQEQICRMMNNLNENPDACEPDIEAVRTVCTEGEIDDIVLQSRIGVAQPIGEYTTGVVENGYEKKFYLYRCSALNPG